MGNRRSVSQQEAQKLHRELLRQRLFARLEAAKAKGDKALLELLEAEQKTLRLW
ncbi:MAG: hypothetical protein ACKO7W_04125 [Elainella sp.]